MAEDFSAFFASTCPGMLAKAILLSGHRQEAEDAVQEAYTEALRSWHRIATYDSPEAWVYKVMSQRLWAAARRTSRQVPSGVDLKVPAQLQADPERSAEARAAIAALGALPGKMRFVMVMHCLNGMSQEEVARELGLARGTVAVYVHGARRLLEKALGLAPARHADQPLVRVPVPAAPFRDYGLAVAADPLARSLRAAENWLREGLAGDGVTVSAIGAAVEAGAARPRRSGVGRRGVRRWLGRAGADSGGSQ
jgi:RNA polymerase sigma factor (sigma-70 family)